MRFRISSSQEENPRELMDIVQRPQRVDEAETCPIGLLALTRPTEMRRHGDRMLPPRRNGCTPYVLHAIQMLDLRCTDIKALTVSCEAHIMCLYILPRAPF